MFDPASMFRTILAIVTMVMEVLKACENKNESMNKWLELAERVKDLAAGDKATAAPVQERLKDAIDGAFKLIKYCQEVGMFSGNVNQSIINSMKELMTLIQVEEEGATTTTSTGSAASHAHAYYQYQPPRGGAGRPTVPCTSGYLTPTEHSHVRGEGLVLAPSSHQSSAHNSWSAHPAFAGSAASHTHCVPASSSSSPGTNVEWWEEHRLVEESLSLARAMNRAKEESLASKRAKEKEEASMNRAKAESLSLARAMEESAMNRAKQESLVSKRSLSSARAEEEAAMNRAKEESITLARAKVEAAMDRARKESLMSAHAKEEATMNRAKKESLASARANEEAAMNRAKKESLASAKEKADLDRVMHESFASYVQDMVRALRVAVNNKDIIFQRQGFN